MIHRLRVLLLAALLPLCNAFSLKRALSRGNSHSPMVQHIPLPTTTPTLTEQRMTATTTGVINGAPPISSTLNPIQSTLVKFGMLSFIAGMCVSLPLTLFPPWILWKLGIYNRIEKEKAALWMGHYCARFLSKLIPFCSVKICGSYPPKPQPAVWVCNHSSMLDVFILLANDDRLRGKDRRPIKIVYVRIYLSMYMHCERVCI